MRGARGGAIAGLCCLALASCGGGSRQPITGGSIVTGSTSATPRATTTSVRSTPATNAIAAARPHPVSASTRPTTTAVGSDRVADAAAGGVGDFAGLLLAAGPVKRIVYDLLLEGDLAPRQHTLDHVLGQLTRFSGNKPISVQRTAVPGGPSQWLPEDIDAFVHRNSKFRSGGDTAVLHVLFVHGDMGDAAGVATGADTLTMFPDSYRGGGLTASEAQIEDTVVMHETGHILGLVDLWLDLHRGDYTDDPAPGGHHSTDPNSVMYWRVETIDVKSFFRGGPPHEFDADDQADLLAIHGGRPRGSKTR